MYRVSPIANELVERARKELKSPQYGHPAHVETANGTGPCRSCLRPFELGAEKRLLFTYNPFEGTSSYPLPGPVFVHEEVCEPYAQRGFPTELHTLPTVLEAYDADRLVIERVPTSDDVDSSIVRLFQDPRVRYIHVRHAEAGCFIALITRA